MSATQTEFPFVGWDEYCQDGRMNASTLVQGFKSMKSLQRAIQGKKPEETAAMRFGQSYHQLILEPEEFRRTHVIMPDFKNSEDNVDGKGKRSNSANTKWCKDAKKKFAEEHSEKAVIGEYDYCRAIDMIKAINLRPRAVELIDGAMRETTLFGEIYGVACKGRLDLLKPGDSITDLKGTNDATPTIFGSLACRLNYPEKMAFYRELVKQNTGETLPVYIICQETEGDFDTVVYPIREPVLEHAFGRVCKLLLQYKDAVKQDKWPGVDGGANEIEFHVPNWWMPDSSDDELEWADAE